MGNPLVSLQSVNFPDRFIRHRNFLGEITPIASALDRADSSFFVVPGLADNNAVSFRSVNFERGYLRHSGFRVRMDLRPTGPDPLFDADATFRWEPGLGEVGAASFRSHNFPTRYIRHRNFELWLEEGVGELFERDSSFRVVRALHYRTRIRVHLKVLTAPTLGLPSMLDAFRLVYGTPHIEVQVVTLENLTLPNLDDLDIGGCFQGQVTEEQDALFANRNNVGANEIVVYFVRSTIPATNGCAAHPAGRPGAVVTRGASQWTLAHEVGHVLGLNHVNDNNRLMTGNGTANITNPPPDIVDAETATMDASPLTLN